MVDEITPTYYAPGQQLTYTLTGRGFHLLPLNALGVRAVLNNDPLYYKDSTDYWPFFNITERNNYRIVLTAHYTGTLSGNAYLGGIVSNDRNIVYWVNNTQPLPATRGDIVEPEFIDER